MHGSVCKVVYVCTYAFVKFHVRMLAVHVKQKLQACSGVISLNAYEYEGGMGERFTNSH